MTFLTLRQRVKTLETRNAFENKPYVGILVGVFDEGEGVVAAASNGHRIARMYGETIANLTARASRELGARFLFAVYSDGIEAG